MSDPYANFREEEAPTAQGDLAAVSKLADELLLWQSRVAGLEGELKAAKEVLRTHEEDLLPEAMEAVGMTSFTLRSGQELVLDEKVYASIGKRKAAAFNWLEANGHGGLIKRTISVAFGKTDIDQADELYAKLRGQFQETKRDLKVEASTLTKFVKDQLEAGHAVPDDIFSVHRRRFVKVKPGK